MVDLSGKRLHKTMERFTILNGKIHVLSMVIFQFAGCCHNLCGLCCGASPRPGDPRASAGQTHDVHSSQLRSSPEELQVAGGFPTGSKDPESAGI